MQPIHAGQGRWSQNRHTLRNGNSDQEENVKDLFKYTTEFVIPYSKTGIPEESVKNL